MNPILIRMMIGGAVGAMVAGLLTRGKNRANVEGHAESPPKQSGERKATKTPPKAAKPDQGKHKRQADDETGGNQDHGGTSDNRASESRPRAEHDAEGGVKDDEMDEQ